MDGSGRLVWAAEVRDVFLQVDRFLAEKGDDCLLWGVWSVRGVGGKVERGWKGGCPASAWAEFRGMRWTVALGISEGKGGGFCLDFRWIEEEYWARFAVGRRGRVAGGFGEVGGGILEDLGGVSGFGLLWKEGVEDLSFLVDF